MNFQFMMLSRAALLTMLIASTVVVGAGYDAAIAAVEFPPPPPVARKAANEFVRSSTSSIDAAAPRPNFAATTEKPQHDASLWDKFQKLFFNSWIGVVILAALAITGGAAKFIDYSRKIAPLLPWHRRLTQATLGIAPLEIGTTVQPLIGCPMITYQGQPTLTDGFRLRFALTHGREANELISVTDIEPMVLYVSPEQADLPSYVIDASKLTPQGLIMGKAEFLMRVAGPAVAEIYWVDGSSRKPAEALSSNLLETQPPRTVLLDSAADQLTTIPGAVKLSDPGYYEICFVIRYLVRGAYKTLQVGPVRVLKQS